MSSNRVYTESVVTLNNQEAKARMDELTRKANELNEALAGVEEGTKQFKALQKQLAATVKEQDAINKDMVKFEKILNDLNGSSLNELQSAARKLNQQVRRLKPGTEEFVAASKKLKEVRTRMREIEDQSRATQKMFGGFFSKIGWAGLVAGALSAFRKFASDMIAQTQLIGDRWEAETAGWKSAYGSFIAGLSSGKGWDEMVQRMKDAYANGKRVAMMLDEIFERNNSALLQESQLNLEAEKQKKIYMDATKSAKERIAAAEEYDLIQQQIAKNRQEVSEQEAHAYKLQLQDRTKLSDDELDLFVRDYNNNKKLIEQANEYRKEYGKMAAEAGRLHNLMMQGGAQAYSAYKADYDNAVAAMDNFRANANQAAVRWSDMIDKYELANDEMVKSYVQARQKVIDADTNYERATQRSARQASRIRKQMAEEAQKALDDAYKEDVAASDARYQELQNQAKQAYADGTISYEQYQTRLNDLNRQSLEERMVIAEKHKQSTLLLQSQLLDLAVADKQKLEKIFTDLEASAVKATEEAIKDMEAEVDEFMKDIDAELEGTYDRWLEMLERSREIQREMHPIDALKEDMEQEMAEIQRLLDEKLISYEDFELKRLEITRHYEKQLTKAQMAPYGKGVAAAQGYIEQVSNFAAAIQEAASARLEAQMQAELTAAGDNAERREQIEAEYEQKQLDLKKKYADVDMGINIAKTVANGAVASIKAFADLGPIAGAIAAAIVAATTIAEVAVIIAQRNAIKNTSVSSSGSSAAMGARVPTGFAEGGYTGSAPNDAQEMGVVHANEWVAPAAMVRQNPVMFASLERMRKQGGRHSGLAGYADGGYTSDEDGAASTQQSDNRLLQKLYDLLLKLEASMPLRAYMVLSDLNAKQELDASIKSIVGKKSS